jgi:hypothetical protein
MRLPRDAARSAILGVCGCMDRPDSLAGTSSPAVSAVHQVRQTVRLARTDSCRDAHSSLVGSGADRGPAADQVLWTPSSSEQFRTRRRINTLRRFRPTTILAKSTGCGFVLFVSLGQSILQGGSPGSDPAHRHFLHAFSSCVLVAVLQLTQTSVDLPCAPSRGRDSQCIHLDWRIGRVPPVLARLSRGAESWRTKARPIWTQAVSGRPSAHDASIVNCGPWAQARLDARGRGLRCLGRVRGGSGAAVRG